MAANAVRKSEFHPPDVGIAGIFLAVARGAVKYNVAVLGADGRDGADEMPSEVQQVRRVLKPVISAAVARLPIRSLRPYYSGPRRNLGRKYVGLCNSMAERAVVVMAAIRHNRAALLFEKVPGCANSRKESTITPDCKYAVAGDEPA